MINTNKVSPMTESIIVTSKSANETKSDLKAEEGSSAFPRLGNGLTKLFPDLVVGKTLFEMFEPKKCCTCPYKLGQIKCIISPCIKCKAEKLKSNPFPKAEIKKSG